jgi:L-threonylcarbamoyladenylate synthase
MIGSDVTKAVDLLRQGKLVAIPTETVYGLAALASDEQAVLDVFRAKARPAFDPLIVHAGSIDVAEKLVKEFPVKARKLAALFWPGPLTLLLAKSDLIPDIITSGNPGVAIRIPDHPLTLRLLEDLGEPVAAPSANPFGYVSPTTAAHVAAQLEEKVAYILDGGPANVGIESTIVSFLDPEPKIIRLGGLSPAVIEEALGEKVMVEVKTHSNPKAPGQLDKHYATAARLVHTDDVPSAYAFWKEKAGEIALLSFFSSYPDLIFSAREVLSPEKNTEQAAKRLFAAMRRLDGLNPEIILAEKFPEEGLGSAINDRLRRASCKKEGNFTLGLEN